MNLFPFERMSSLDISGVCGGANVEALASVVKQATGIRQQTFFWFEWVGLRTTSTLREHSFFKCINWCIVCQGSVNKLRITTYWSFLGWAKSSQILDSAASCTRQTLTWHTWKRRTVIPQLGLEKFSEAVYQGLNWLVKPLLGICRVSKSPSRDHIFWFALSVGEGLRAKPLGYLHQLLRLCGVMSLD